LEDSGCTLHRHGKRHDIYRNPVNGRQADGALRLMFDGPEAESDVEVTVDFVTTDEVIDAPMLTVTDADGREIGRTRPPTEAPPPRPGPVYADNQNKKKFNKN